MAFLRIRRKGKIINIMPLDNGKSYLAGRKDGCDIQLGIEKGISREHFRLYFQDEQWNVEVLSKFGEVLVGGEKVHQFTLEPNQSFSVPPYEFEFTFEDKNQNSTSGVSHISQASSKVSMPLVTRSSAAPALNEEEYLDEKTHIGSTTFVPFIKFLDANQEEKESVALEGEGPWIAGRDPHCPIFIRDSHVSRRQFEIRKHLSEFSLMDLGSVNGTKLNGQTIPAEQAHPLRSGDQITVLENVLCFELRDPYYQNKIQQTANLPVLQNTSLTPTYNTLELPQMYHPMGTEQQQIPFSPNNYPTNNDPQWKSWLAKNKIRVALGTVILVLLGLIFSGPDKSKTSKPGKNPANPFESLTQEQKNLVKQTHQLSKNYYMQGKYELALSEIAKLEQIIPEYEDSTEIKRMANEGVQLTEEKHRQEQVDLAKIEQEEKIRAQVTVCKSKLNPNVTVSEIEVCLSPVMEFNPEHPMIVELKAKADQLVTQRQIHEEKQKDYQERVRRLQSLHQQALSYERTGDLLKAIAAYERVVAADLPDPKALKSLSKQQIINLQNQVSTKTQSFIKDADRMAANGNYKSAILSLRKAKQFDPENGSLQDKIDSYTLELKKQVMLLYQEGVLEESYGNVDGSEGRSGAKDKWKKILELDIPDGEYYQKAKLKLKKYGVI